MKPWNTPYFIKPKTLDELKEGLKTRLEGVKKPKTIEDISKALAKERREIIRVVKMSEFLLGQESEEFEETSEFGYKLKEKTLTPQYHNFDNRYERKVAG